jgi:hypothetical protein
MHSGLSSGATVICFLASMQMEANCVFNVPQAILHPTAQASAMLLSASALDLAVAVSARQHAIEQTVARLTAKTMQII